MERRDFMALGATAVATTLYGGETGSMANPKGVDRMSIATKELTFDPKKLSGISEKMILSHHRNNYEGAVKRANAIGEKIGALTPTAQPFELGSLKREEMVALNSMILHEYYFDNLGSAGILGEKLRKALEKSFGSVAKWENSFKKMALSLGGGSGWALLVYNRRLARLENVWSWDHLHGLWDSEIILALDMYEHSYQMDFGANAKGYIDVFFTNIHWDAVNGRFQNLS
jgi:Fe-Mn family superoxide dismutase